MRPSILASSHKAGTKEANWFGRHLVASDLSSLTISGNKLLPVGGTRHFPQQLWSEGCHHLVDSNFEQYLLEQRWWRTWRACTHIPPNSSCSQAENKKNVLIQYSFLEKGRHNHDNCSRNTPDVGVLQKQQTNAAIHENAR